MNKKKWMLLIAVLFLGLGGILGGIWWWDTKNYPMPGIPEAPPTPFAHSHWDWSESVVTNLSRVQERLRSNRHSRLREEWIRELKLADTYWSFRGRKYAIHFGEDGNVRVRKSAAELSDELEKFQSYERIGISKLVLFSERDEMGESTRVSLSAIGQDSIMLVKAGTPLSVIDRASSSSHFDSLEN